MDPTTELPTREFYILADLLFDAIDQRYEPRGTGLLEAHKMLEFDKAQEVAKGPGHAMADEVAREYFPPLSSTSAYQT